MSTEVTRPLDTSVTILNGRLVRPGFYRRNTDGSSAKYTAQVATGGMDKDCVFCPPVQQANMIEAPEGFSAFRASAPYQYWDNHEVQEHLMVTPDVHVTSLLALGDRAIKRLQDFMGDLRQTERQNGVTVQDYTRVKHNFSKSVGHVHTHAFFMTNRPVSSLEYSIRDGLTHLEFGDPDTDNVPVARAHWDAQEIVDVRTINPDDLIVVYPKLGRAASLLMQLEAGAKELQESDKSSTVYQPYLRVDIDGNPQEAKIFGISPNPVTDIRQNGSDVAVEIATLTPEQQTELIASRAA